MGLRRGKCEWHIGNVSNSIESDVAFYVRLRFRSVWINPKYVL